MVNLMYVMEQVGIATTCVLGFGIFVWVSFLQAERNIMVKRMDNIEKSVRELDVKLFNKLYEDRKIKI